MKAQPQSRILTGKFDGVLRSLAVDHQTGRREDAFPMRADDGLIDGMRAAEIVGVDDEPADRAHRVIFTWFIIHLTVNSELRAVEGRLLWIGLLAGDGSPSP